MNTSVGKGAISGKAHAKTTTYPTPKTNKLFI